MSIAHPLGCIPVISDQTPWAHIADKGGGYILSLSNQEKFGEMINMLAATTFGEITTIQENAVAIAQDKIQQSKKNTGYRRVFDMRC